MADDKKNIPEAAPPVAAPAPAVENTVVPEQPAPEPVLTDAEAVMLEHEGQAALFEMGDQGYEIIQAVMLENGRGFALGHNPAAPSPYVTWACYDDRDGQRQYEWGHYGSDRAALEQDFAARVQEYQRLYNVGVKQTEAPGLYKYYSTQRPVDIGTFPKPPRNAPDEIVNYDQRVPVENGSFLAWGHLTYTRPLTKRQASDYELRPAPDNPDRPRSIREQMKTAAKQAEADRGQAAPKKNAPDRGDR